MDAQMCSYEGAIDQQRMVQLVQLFPEHSLHVVDLPYRLSSWVFGCSAAKTHYAAAVHGR